MGVDVYDKALTAKIQAVFKNTLYQTREQTNHTVTDKNGKVSYPLISIFRPDGYAIDKTSATWNQEVKFVNGFHAVPIKLSYQIDIYANTREDLEDITSELLLYLLRNRGISVLYTSADKKYEWDVRTNLDYVSGPERTTEIDDKTVGRPYRYTLTFELKNAYIYEVSSNLTDDNPEGLGYIPKVTEVIVSIIPEVDVTVNTEGDSHKTEYIDKEVIYGKN